MLPLTALAHAPAAGGGLLLAMDAAHHALESYVRAGGGLRRVSRIAVSVGRYPSLAGVDERRRLAYVRALRNEGEPASFAAFHYDARGRLSFGAVTPIEPAVEAIGFDPTGAFAALVGSNGARTCRVTADGTLRPLAGRPLQRRPEGSSEGSVPETSGTGIAASGDGRRLFALTSGGVADIHWSGVRAYGWRQGGRLARLPFRSGESRNWDSFAGLAPDRSGRAAFEFGETGEGKAGRWLGARREIRGREVPGPPCVAAVYDDAWHGLFLLSKGRLDWVSDRAPGHRRTLTRTEGWPALAWQMAYDKDRRELVVYANGEHASRLDIYGVDRGLRVERRFHATFGPGYGPAVWVAR